MSAAGTGRVQVCPVAWAASTWLNGRERYPAEFRDVNVRQLTGGVTDVAAGQLAAHREPGGLAEAGQGGHPVAHSTG